MGIPIEQKKVVFKEAPTTIRTNGPIKLSSPDSEIVVDWDVNVSARMQEYFIKKFGLKAKEAQRKKKVPSMTIDGFEAIVDLGEPAKVLFPFNLEGLRLGGNGANFRINHALVSQVFDPNFDPGIFEIPSIFESSKAAEALSRIGFTTQFRDFPRNSLVMPKVNGQGLIISQSPKTENTEIHTTSGDQLYLGFVPEVLNHDPAQADIYFSPSSATLRDIVEGKITLDDMRRLAESTSLVSMNMDEATGIAKTYFPGSDPVDSLIAVGFRQGMVTHDASPIKYFNGAKSGEVSPIVDEWSLRSITSMAYGLSDPANDSTGGGDGLMGGTAAALRYMEFPEAVLVGVRMGALNYSSKASNPIYANLEGVADVVNGYF